jgi:CTP:phosphocholine cytidylyltransferase-like protein
MTKKELENLPTRELAGLSNIIAEILEEREEENKKLYWENVQEALREYLENVGSIEIRDPVDYDVNSLEELLAIFDKPGVIG